ncbi:MAG: hypothetical protein R2799_15695 [Crocinitomicaceae bacterium]
MQLLFRISLLLLMLNQFSATSFSCSMYKLTKNETTMVGCNEDAWRTTPHIWISFSSTIPWIMTIGVLFFFFTQKYRVEWSKWSRWILNFNAGLFICLFIGFLYWRLLI